MADEPAVVAEPAEEVLTAPMVRPEARAELDALSERIFGTASEPPAEPDAAATPAPAQGKAADVAPVPAKPATDVPPGVLPPDSLLDGGTPPAVTAEPVPPTEEIFPEEPPAAIRTEKGKADYKKWRESYKSVEAENKELKAKLEKAPQPDDLAQARIAELEARNAEMSQQVEKVALTEHPAFVSQFTAPLKQLHASAEQIVKDAGLETDTLERVLSLSGIERVKAMDALAETIDSPTLRRRLERTVEDIEAKEGERAKVLSDVKGNVERLTRQEKISEHQRLQQQAQQLTAMVEGVVDHFARTVKIPFFQKADGNDTWNATLDEDNKTTLDLVTNNTDQNALVGAVALGVKFPRVLAWGQAERRARIAAEKALAERRGAEPSLDGGAGGGNGHGTPEDDPNDTDMSPEGIRRRFNARVRT